MGSEVDEPDGIIEVREHGQRPSYIYTHYQFFIPITLAQVIAIDKLIIG